MNAAINIGYQNTALIKTAMINTAVIKPAMTKPAMTKTVRTKLRHCLLSLLATGCMVAVPGVACVEGAIRGEMVIAKRDVGATPTGQGAVFHLLGAGWLRSAEIVKRGGDTDKTYVSLELDGEPVIKTSFANLKNPWMQLNTPLIVADVKTEGDVSRMTIWYSPELKFRSMLLIRVEVKEDGVESVNMRATMNKPAPHEHVAGQPGGILAALPVFE